MTIPAALSPRHRDIIVHILEAALHAVDPLQAVRNHLTISGETLRIGPRDYRLDEIERILVIGGGKAGTPMAAAVYQVLGDRITNGIINVKYGHTAGAGGWQVRFGRGGEPVTPSARAETGPIHITEAGHPVPDAAGQAGAQKIVALLNGLTSRDLVLVLISGGGSALLPLPAEGISLADIQALTQLLLGCGADITEINAVRKHCSRLQGGQLARLAWPAQVATLILSDVVGTPLDAIASGPTVPDHSTFADAWAVLERYAILDQVPDSVRSHLQRGLAGLIPDTPKTDDPVFRNVNNVVIGDNLIAGRAAVAEAQRWGMQGLLLTTFIQGEAREVGRVVAGLAQGIATGQSSIVPPVCLVLGGETTVTLRGKGLGGRNQELALAAAIALDGYPLPANAQVAVVSLGTDGTDGPTDAAGGIATVDSLARGRAAGLDGRAALADNDSYHFLSALGDLIITGPTQTNVNDLILVCCWPGV
ncbi:MAG: glycerate kinase type-2 family protein [Anaerolineae bacterium]